MKSSWLSLIVLSLQLGSPPARAAGDAPVLRLDPSLDRLVAPDASLETLFERDTIFEGPTWVRDGGAGYLIFSDVPGNVIDKMSPDGNVSALVRNIFSGSDTAEAYESTGPKKYRMMGANGTTLDRRGRLVYCAFSDGRIVRVDRHGRRTVLASQFDGRRLNAPNDLVYRSDGALYFTDSRAGTRHADGEGVPHKGLYMLEAGHVRLLSGDIDHPNGLAFSPDEKYLYVTNTLRKNILRLEVREARVASEMIFAEMSGDARPGAPDGIKVDRHGNVYSTGPGGVWIMSPGGRHIGTIVTPKPITNLAFGARDFKSLYLTGLGSLYRIRLNTAGK
jgi:gluconolactonase